MWRWSYGLLAYQPSRADLGLPDSIFQWACYALASVRFSVLMNHVWTCTHKCHNEDQVGGFIRQSCTCIWGFSFFKWAGLWLYVHAREIICLWKCKKTLMNCERWNSELTSTAYKKQFWKEKKKKKKEYLMLTEVYYGNQHLFFAELPAHVSCAVVPPVLSARQDLEGFVGKWGAWGDMFP